MLLPYDHGFRADRDRSGAEYPYLQNVLDALYHVRRYGFKPHEIQYNAEFPVYFRQHREFVLDNRKHAPVDCDMYDADPLTNDLSVISITGTGLGVDYEGNWNTVSHRMHYGSFRGEKDENGEYPEIIRKSVLDFPEHGESF